MDDVSRPPAGAKVSNAVFPLFVFTTAPFTSTPIPNLAASDTLRMLPGGLARAAVLDEVGFTFRAAVALDMREVQRSDKDARAIEFRRSPGDDADFKAYHGVWKLTRVTSSETAFY